MPRDLSSERNTPFGRQSDVTNRLSEIRQREPPYSSTNK
ncbi:hypothetical protein JCM19235_1274 [Vibrio maritimus]|uniref:Uncharacterized protein n=1 Tax=Vibrio maritimus TaxID=990268 RepID=A0A090S876_9VIBR|nr:hypothetical protein JCM19235_1274 [Vibrio maritimus]